MRPFIGRKEELEWLELLLEKQVASLVVIRGRRRIGKSRLIEEFGRRTRCHIISGLPPSSTTTRKGQLDAFCRQVARAFDLPKFQVEDWESAFWELGKRCQEGRVVIALDEISWIGSKDGDFLGELKNAWDLVFSKNPELILILCGSVSSWIERNILGSTGFVGRVSVDLHLKELCLSEAASFWGDTRERISPHEIFKVLSVTGGVPRYLEEIKSTLSAEENIRRLCFNPRGLLYREFDQIFDDLFWKRAPIYAPIVRALADGSCSLNELSEVVSRAPSTVSEYMKDLRGAGFVSEDPAWNLATMRVSKAKNYRLSDNYLRFYSKYVAPHKESLDAEMLGLGPLSGLPEWDTIMGLQFENLVLRNIRDILGAIHVPPSDVVHFGPFFRKQSKRHAGVQVDILVQTRYRTLFLCEVKFLSRKVGMEVVHQVRDKQERLSLPRGWSLRPVLIHVNGVTTEVLQSSTFDHVVDFSKLIN